MGRDPRPIRPDEHPNDYASYVRSFRAAERTAAASAKREPLRARGNGQATANELQEANADLDRLGLPPVSAEAHAYAVKVQRALLGSAKREYKYRNVNDPGGKRDDAATAEALRRLQED